MGFDISFPYGKLQYIWSMKMKKVILKSLILIGILSVLMTGCSDPSSSDDTNNQGTQLNWPEGFLYQTANAPGNTNPAIVRGEYTRSNSSNTIAFYSNGYLFTRNGATRFRITHIIDNGILVQAVSSDDPQIIVRNTYVLCEDFIISGDTITLIGSNLPTTIVTSVLTRTYN